MPDPSPGPAPDATPDAVPAPVTRPVTRPATGPGAASLGDRLLLAALAIQAALLLVAAFAQVTDNRALLDLFDFRRLFVR